MLEISEVGISTSAAQPSSFSVGFFSVFLCFGKGTTALCFPCTISKASARIFGEKLGPSGGDEGLYVFIFAEPSLA